MNQYEVGIRTFCMGVFQFQVREHSDTHPR